MKAPELKHLKFDTDVGNSRDPNLVAYVRFAVVFPEALPDGSDYEMSHDGAQIRGPELRLYWPRKRDGREFKWFSPRSRNCHEWLQEEILRRFRDYARATVH